MMRVPFSRITSVHANPEGAGFETVLLENQPPHSAMRVFNKKKAFRANDSGDFPLFERETEGRKPQKQRLPLRSLLCFVGQPHNVSSSTISVTDEYEEPLIYSPPHNVAEMWMRMNGELLGEHQPSQEQCWRECSTVTRSCSADTTRTSNQSRTKGLRNDQPILWDSARRETQHKVRRNRNNAFIPSPRRPASDPTGARLVPVENLLYPPTPPPRDCLPKALEDKRVSLSVLPKNFQSNRDIVMAASDQTWKSAVDPKTGRTYYYNTVTRETQWRKPLELASETERKEMQEKERKQKDFFAAMEANILKSMAVGQAAMPSPKPIPARDPSLKLGKTKLVRTISAMDDNILKNLVQRVPSGKIFQKPRKPGFLRSSVGSNATRASVAGNRLETMRESAREDYSFEMSKIQVTEDIVFEPDGSDSSPVASLNDVSLGRLEREESLILDDLEKITDQMAHLSTEEGELSVGDLEFSASDLGDAAADFNFSRAVALNMSSDEISFDPNSLEGESPDEKGEREDVTPLSEDQMLADAAAEVRRSYNRTISPKTQELIADIKESDLVEKKPDFKRRNTCGTLYIGTTMAAPDTDATIKCVCGVYRAHIIASDQDEKETGYDPSNDQYRKFNDRETQRMSTPKVVEELEADGLQFEEFEKDVPALDEICNFYRDVFRRAQMEADCIIMSLVYVERLIKVTEGALRPRKANWRSLLFSCMILSSKVWDDLSMWNLDFSQTCPAGVVFSLKRVNELEVAVLTALKYKVKVPASEYAKYYFLLRSMLIKSGLCEGEDLRNMMPLDLEGAKKLELVSSSFQKSANNKRRARNADAIRSKSMGDAEQGKLLKGAQRAQQANLEQMVQL